MTPDAELDLNGNIQTHLSNSTSANSTTGHVEGFPIAGMWAPSITSATAAEDAALGAQLENSDASYFGWVSGQRYIQIKKAGWYLIMADVAKGSLSSGELTTMELHRDNSAGSKVATLCRAYANAGGGTSIRVNLSCSAIERFNANDRVVLFDANGTSQIIGGSALFPNSSLKILKLN